MPILNWNPRNFGLGRPFLELERMKSHMESMYHTLANSVSNLKKNYTGVFPLVNLLETDQNLYLTAELQGAVADKLEVSVKGDALTLRGEIKTPEPGEEVNFHRRERESGSFRRSLTLPVKVDVESVDACFKNGILTVTMPKAAEAVAHQISVKTE